MAVDFDYALLILDVMLPGLDGWGVLRGGQRIKLTAKEFALLELLLRHPGEVLPRSLIASQVWDINFDSDTNVIDVSTHSGLGLAIVKSIVLAHGGEVIVESAAGTTSFILHLPRGETT